MKDSKTLRIISNIMYGIGVAAVLFLAAVWLFGPSAAVNPDAMLPVTHRERAFLGLAVGVIPMSLACAAVYCFNGLSGGPRKVRYFLLTFLPAFACLACALFLAGVFLVGMVNSFILR
jgi:hypothetical protein